MRRCVQTFGLYCISSCSNHLLIMLYILIAHEIFKMYCLSTTLLLKITQLSCCSQGCPVLESGPNTPPTLALLAALYKCIWCWTQNCREVVPEEIPELSGHPR